jgi:TonB family protein
MTWTNLLHYCGQILAVAAAAELLLWILRVRDANLRVRFLQASLALCLILPFVQPSRTLTRAEAIATVTATPGAEVAKQVTTRIPVEAIWAGGACALLLRLALGLAALRRMRARARDFGTSEGIPVKLADGLSSPVVFGFRSPVVLLPAQASSTDAAVLAPMIDHELEHVRRRDWVYTLAEELIRVALWFHPAVWRMLANIRAARELAVDQAVAARTSDSVDYAESLLTAASWRCRPAPPQPAIAMFRTTASLRKRLHRIQNLEQETLMTPFHRKAAIGALTAALAGAALLTTSTLPLFAATPAAAAQEDDVVKPKLLHKTTPKYPAAAKEQKIQGTVVLDVTIGTDGAVVNAKVKSGDPILADAAVESVKEWEFSPGRKGGKAVEVIVTIEVNFTLAP